jgi:hypothetical protein
MASKLLCCLDADQGAREQGKVDRFFLMHPRFKNFRVGQMKIKIRGCCTDCFCHESQVQTKLPENFSPLPIQKQSRMTARPALTKCQTPSTPPPSSPLCPVNCMILTRELVITPMQGHTEMGGKCPSIGKIGFKVTPQLLVNRGA